MEELSNTVFFRAGGYGIQFCKCHPCKARGRRKVTRQPKRAHPPAIGVELKFAGKQIFRLPWRELHIIIQGKHLLVKGRIICQHAQVTVKGYGGEIEIVVGVDNDGVITGINVGGANFSETAGLGAKTKEPAFTEQFKGLSAPLTLKGNVDSVSGASVSSGAIVNGVNTVLDYVAGLEK